MRLTLNVCGICKDSSFATNFLQGARLQDSEGAQFELCENCVSHMMIRFDMYELRPDFIRSSMPSGKYENDRRSSNPAQDHRPSPDSRRGEIEPPRRTGEQPVLPEK